MKKAKEPPRRILEHAGRTIRVRLEHSPVDPASLLSRKKLMVVIYVLSPQGVEFSFSLPPEKAKEFSEMIGCAIDEYFVKGVMIE